MSSPSPEIGSGDRAEIKVLPPPPIDDAAVFPYGPRGMVVMVAWGATVFVYQLAINYMNVAAGRASTLTDSDFWINVLNLLLPPAVFFAFSNARWIIWLVVLTTGFMAFDMVLRANGYENVFFFDDRKGFVHIMYQVSVTVGFSILSALGFLVFLAKRL